VCFVGSQERGKCISAFDEVYDCKFMLVLSVSTVFFSRYFVSL